MLTCLASGVRHKWQAGNRSPTQYTRRTERSWSSCGTSGASRMSTCNPVVRHPWRPQHWLPKPRHCYCAMVFRHSLKLPCHVPCAKTSCPVSSPTTGTRQLVPCAPVLTVPKCMAPTAIYWTSSCDQAPTNAPMRMAGRSPIAPVCWSRSCRLSRRKSAAPGWASACHR